MAFYFYKNKTGAPTEMETFTAGGAISAGDVVTVNGSTQNEVIALASTGGATPVGVASHTAASGADVNVVLATHDTYFLTTSGATGYTDATHKLTEGTIDATSMNVVVAGSTNGGDGFTVVGYVDDADYTDGGTNNKVFGFFSSCELD
jgi:hypothetical protein